MRFMDKQSLRLLSSNILTPQLSDLIRHAMEP